MEEAVIRVAIEAASNATTPQGVLNVLLSAAVLVLLTRGMKRPLPPAAPTALRSGRKKRKRRSTGRAPSA